MGLFNRLFGSKDDLPALRKALAQHRFADARLIAQELDSAALSEDELSEFEQLRTEAGDRLARLNLDEGLGLKRSGDNVRALEHLQLAEEQAVSAGLLEEVRKELQAIGSEVVRPAAKKASLGGSCSSCGPAPTGEPLMAEESDLPDFASRIDLILASYPADMAERYRGKSLKFLEAFLVAHEEDEAAALKLLKKIPEEEKDDLYYFEVGSLMGRLGKVQDAVKYLKTVLDKNPDHLLAAETLILIQVSSNQGKEALARLEEMLAKGQDPAFCHAQLAQVRFQMKDFDNALPHAQQALAMGSADPQLMLIAAGLLERAGDVKNAEKLLARLPGGGCGGGGGNVYLAELWLRQNKNLAKALDSFNAACRQEPDNPRWQLRVAQTYIARKWDKQGLDLLSKVVNDPKLAPELREEGKALLASKA